MAENSSKVEDRMCHECGNEGRPMARFCARCGATLTNPISTAGDPAQIPQPTKARAGLVMVRCTAQQHPYLVRFVEHKPAHWWATQAIPVTEALAASNGYGERKIEGSLSFAPDWHGCPFCKAGGLVRHSCGRLICWRAQAQQVCTWCHRMAQPKGESISRLDAYDDY